MSCALRHISLFLGLTLLLSAPFGSALHSRDLDEDADETKDQDADETEALSQAARVSKALDTFESDVGFEVIHRVATALAEAQEAAATAQVQAQAAAKGTSRVVSKAGSEQEVSYGVVRPKRPWYKIPTISVSDIVPSVLSRLHLPDDLNDMLMEQGQKLVNDTASKVSKSFHQLKHDIGAKTNKAVMRKETLIRAAHEQTAQRLRALKRDVTDKWNKGIARGKMKIQEAQEETEAIADARWKEVRKRHDARVRGDADTPEEEANQEYRDRKNDMKILNDEQRRLRRPQEIAQMEERKQRARAFDAANVDH